MNKQPILRLVTARAPVLREQHRTESLGAAFQRWCDTVSGIVFAGLAFIAVTWFAAALVLSLGPR